MLEVRDLRSGYGAVEILRGVSLEIHAGEIVAVLGSLYPAVTSGLAHVVLRERLGRVQLLGVVLALVGVALLATR